MQTVATNISFLTGLSSSNELAGFYLSSNPGRLYQQLALNLSRNLSIRQVAAQIGARLVSGAEYGYSLQQNEVLDQASKLLVSLPLPRQFQIVGSYYRAILELRKGDHVGARSRLESVMADATPSYRARATVCLAVTWEVVGDLESALRLYADAAGLATSEECMDPLPLSMARINAAIVKSRLGEHRVALKELEELYPIVRSIALRYPREYYNYLNSLAVEMGEAGRIEEAQNICKITAASSLAKVHPRWLETRDEIAQKAQKASRSFVAFNKMPQLEPDNLVRLPLSDQTAPSDSDVNVLAERPRETARVLNFTDWRVEMTKDPIETSPDWTRYEQMTKKQKLIRIVDLISNKLTDDQLNRILAAVEQIAPDDQVKP